MGDKVYTYIDASQSFVFNSSVNATEAAGVHSFNVTNLADASSNDFLKYSITITDNTNYFLYNKTNEVDVLGNINGGSTTTVYSDAFTTVLNTTPLVGTQTGATYTTNGLQTLYVQTQITNVDAFTHRIQSVNFDVTQSNAVPEPSTYALLCISLGVVGYARKKMNKKL